MKTILKIALLAGIFAFTTPQAKAENSMQSCYDAFQTPLQRMVCANSLFAIDANNRDGWPAGYAALLRVMDRTQLAARQHNWSDETLRAWMDAIAAAWPPFHLEMQSRARVSFQDPIEHQEAWLTKAVIERVEAKN